MTSRPTLPVVSLLALLLAGPAGAGDEAAPADPSAAQAAAADDAGRPLFGSEEEATSYDHFCYRFDAIEWMLFYRTIKEIEATPWSVDKFLTVAACQSQEQPLSVKSPLLHFIVEDTVKRERFLSLLWEYYTKKRHAPERFALAVNAKNTQGETLLDYLATYFRNGRHEGDLKEAGDRIAAVACAHGAVYATHPEKHCP